MLTIELNCTGKTPEDVREELAEALQFPDYYGKNWDAFDECMCDLDWLEDIDEIHITLIDYKPDNSDGYDGILYFIPNSIWYWRNDLEQQKHDMTPHKKISLLIQ